MRVWLLDCGTLAIDHGQLMWNVRLGEKLRFPVYAVLVEHPSGLHLFDTGYDAEHAAAALPETEPLQHEEQTIPAQLDRCGFAPADVGVLVNSHLHFDHVGGNRHLPDAKVVVHAREIVQARSCEPFEVPAYSDRQWDHPGARLVPVRGDHEVAPGLTLFETPGHTVGHYSLLVRAGGRRRAMLFPFDVVYTEEAYRRGIQPGFHHDPVAGVRAIRRIQALAREHDADLFFPHDAEAWRGYRHAPVAYA